MDVYNQGRAPAESPGVLSDRPKHEIHRDPLADLFTATRVESVVYGRLEAIAPWGFSFDAPSQAKFGMVLKGNGWLSVEGRAESVALRAGDWYLLPPGNKYTLRDDPRTRARSVTELWEQSPGGVSYRGGGASTAIIAGKFTFGGPFGKPLTESLPPVIRVRAEDAPTLALQTTLRLILSEMTSPERGSQAVVSRLAEILFVQAIRACVASSGCPKAEWLRAFSDPPVAAALKSMHEHPGHSWTVAELASVAGMSRSAFALRFKQLTGAGPLEYLTRWRMFQAARLLREGGNKKLIEVANLVGYDSDGAFNKAFQRVLGVTPGDYRSKTVSHAAAWKAAG